MRPFIAALPMLIAACATVSSGENPPQEVGANGACTTEGLQELAGQPATSELGAEAMRRSGARALRWIRPGDAVTMDYRQDRLNVRLDAENRVEGFDCG